MKIQLKRKNDKFHFEGTTETNKKINIDAAPEIGGENKGARPMELVLVGLGGCASIDLGLILNKQKQHLDDVKISVSGERSTQPSKHFERINIHFDLIGNLNKQKVEKALELTFKKYCSVALSLSDKISLNYTYTIYHE